MVYLTIPSTFGTQGLECLVPGGVHCGIRGSPSGTLTLLEPLLSLGLAFPLVQGGRTSPREEASGTLSGHPFPFITLLLLKVLSSHGRGVVMP